MFRSYLCLWCGPTDRERVIVFKSTFQSECCPPQMFKRTWIASFFCSIPAAYLKAEPDLADWEGATGDAQVIMGYQEQIFPVWDDLRLPPF